MVHIVEKNMDKNFELILVKFRSRYSIILEQIRPMEMQGRMELQGGE